MAARPDIILDPSTIRPAVVQTAPVVAYRVVKRSTDDNGCTHSAAGEGGYAVALEDGAVGDVIPVCHLQGNPIVPVKVGTGGATRDAYAVVVADGLTNIAAGLGLGSAAARNVVGKFTQSGAVGELVGLMPGPFTAGSS